MKLTGFFILIPLGAYYLWKSRKDFFFGISLSVALLTFAPTLYLKYKYLGGAILFPGFLNIFPGSLDPYLIENFKVFTENPFSMEGLIKNFKNFFLAKFFLLSTPFLILRQWKKERRISPSILISITYLLLWLLLNGGIGEPRFIFTCFFLNILYFFEQFKTFALPEKNGFTATSTCFSRL